MKIEDIRLLLNSKKGVDKVVEKYIPKEERCNHPDCEKKAVVPDGGIMYCSDHHFKCAIQYRDHQCENRVPKLGDICEECKKKKLNKPVHFRYCRR